MPYVTDWRGSYLCRKFSGRISSEEVTAATEEITNDPRFDQLSVVISDYLDITDIDLTIQEAIRLAHSCYAAAKSNPRVRVGVILTHETAQALAALVRYEFEELNGPWEFAYFSTRDEAKRWLRSLPNYDADKFPCGLFPEYATD